MPYQTCGNCGNQLTAEDKYCGQCGWSTEKTYIKGEPTILAPPSGPLRDSQKTNNIHSPDISSQQTALQRSKPTQRISTQSSSSTKRASTNKKKRNLFFIATKWVIHHPKFWPTIIVIGIILFFAFFIKSQTDEDNYLDSPNYGLQSYCDALKGASNYDSAYSFLSSRDSGKSSITKNEFIARVKQIADPQHGIGDCTINITNQYGDIAHGTITYTYGNGKHSTQQYEVFHAGLRSWKIETSDWLPMTAPVA